MTDLLSPPDDGVVDRADLEARMATHRAELTGYCYRMLGSSFDAEDAVQDTMVRAWRSLDKLQGPGALRSWLYRIATNVCLDALDGRKRRALPVDLSDEPSAPVEASLAGSLPEGSWVEPALTRQVVAVGSDPADVAVTRDSVRLAFVAALQVLPPRQRAVLVLREVLRWKAEEVARLLDTSVPAVNSALQRARATVAAQTEAGKARPGEVDADQTQLLAGYVDAFTRYDMDAFVALLHADAVQDMPPFTMWLRSAQDIVAWMVGPGSACEGSTLVPVSLNGSTAFAQYKPGDVPGVKRPFAFQALEVHEGRISRITSFLDTRLFALFGLPAELREGDPLPEPSTWAAPA
ncbi:sigma-70 family RNA polymerase sigma factor [Modestobacter sp. Leaf380]|uniref:sigma-70 family RNA polymerase sigma factor n=1 Tax=Modestobacter sp. Leaf380 TaxID=1736356 RepID=UPI0006FA1A03|nr:sigma-70 family RNA polymerase sigma factor [Modestobacter sp. Leaf380]KQS66153.1 RNA polymerase subunit sigma-70 [Modestobacter sp. Leaf380]